MMGHHRGIRRSASIAISLLVTLLSISSYYSVSASAIAPPLAARLATKRKTQKVVASAPSESQNAASISQSETPSGAMSSTSSAVTTKKAASSNPIVQLATYVKDSFVNFKNGLGEMNLDHRRCNDIRAKQRTFATNNGFKRPRGVKGIQTGGISYEEYDFLRKGLVNRNKLFAVSVVMACLPNYFVYYLWSFPDMLPSPFLKVKDMQEISRERCHAVISTLLDIEKGARVAPWTAKLNPFGGRATQRAMDRLGNFVNVGSAALEEYGVSGPSGCKIILKKLRAEIYTKDVPSKQRMLLAGNTIPKQFMKGLTKAISADPLNKGFSIFGISPLKHIESVALADGFIIDQNVDIDLINSNLLSEACSARLIGGPGWTDEERKEALFRWLKETEVKPRAAVEAGAGHYNGNLARAALMCYNALDATRDPRSDSRLMRSLYQGQMVDPMKMIGNAN
eukprot:scaffold6934_cov105-Skeletonema_marinoi.AAC.3